MEMLISTQCGQVLIQLSGDMYIEDAAKFRSVAMTYLQTGYIHYVIDMSDVTYIDSSGLGAFVALHKRAQQSMGSVSIKGLSGMIKELFELTRLTRLLDIVS